MLCKSKTHVPHSFKKQYNGINVKWMDVKNKQVTDQNCQMALSIFNKRRNSGGILLFWGQYPDFTPDLNNKLPVAPPLRTVYVV